MTEIEEQQQMLGITPPVYGQTPKPGKKPRSWNEVSVLPEYQQADENERAAIKRSYFDTIISPRLPKTIDTDQAWQKFDADTGGLPYLEKEPFGVEYAPTIGSVIGGTAGALVGIPGGPPGMAGGGMAGTAAGAFTGSAYQQAWRKAKNPRKAPQSADETIFNLVKDVGQETVLEGVGHGVLAGGRVARRMLPKPELEPGAREAQNLLQSRSQKASLTSSQATQSSIADAAEQFARSGLGGSNVFRNLDQANKKAIIELRREAIESLTSIPEDDLVRVSGGKLQEALNAADKAVFRAGDALYDDVDRTVARAQRSRLIQAGKVTPRRDVVDMKPLLDWAKQEQLTRVKRGAGEDPILTKFVNDQTKAPRLTFRDAHSRRSDFGKAKRDMETSTAEKSQQGLEYLRTLEKMTEQQMELGARKIGPDVYSKYRNAQNFWKDAVLDMRNETVAAMVAKKPEFVGKLLAKPGNVTDIETITTALSKGAKYDKSINYKQVMDDIKAGFLQEKFGKRGVIDPQEGMKGETLWKELNSGPEARTFRKMFSPQEQESIQNFAKAMELSQIRTPKGMGVRTGALGTQFIGGGLLIAPLAYWGQNEYTIGPAALGLGLILTPAVLARVMTNPQRVNRIVNGITSPQKPGYFGTLAKELIPIGAKVTGAQGRAIIEEDK